MKWMLLVRIAGFVWMATSLSSCAWLFGWKSQPVVAVEPPTPAPAKPKPGPPNGEEFPPLPEPKPEPEPTPPTPAPKVTVPVARSVPGRPGFVFSPFNNKLIDVEGIASGRLVADPHYPASEKKHFRVP